MSNSQNVKAALAEAHARYERNNPISRQEHESATDVLPGGNTRTVLFYGPFPIMMRKGEGCYLWDADGHKYLDALGEYTAGIYGHSNPRIQQALREAMSMGLNLGGHTVMEQKLARIVCDRFPSINKVRFTNSGTEANLMALGAARAFTGRDKILAFHAGYHGGVLYYGTPGPINAPFDTVLARYNEVESTRSLIREHGHTLAAIIIEPMLGGGGCIPATREFLEMLSTEASAHGIVLIFDEVMTSRLSPGGLQAKLGILPDVTTLGKYVGGGMSFGAFGGREDIMAQFDPRSAKAYGHAGTFNNNVMTMSAGVAAMSEVYTPEAAVQLNARGDALRNRLNDLCMREEVPIQFTGIGSMMTVHMADGPLTTPEAAAKSNQDLKELFFFDLLDRDVYIARRGMINLSLPMGDAECDRLVDETARFIENRRALLEAE